MIKVDFGTGELIDDYEKEIVFFCEKLARSLLEKYRKGKVEHGGIGPFKIDCQKEINMEVMDILNYHLISKVNSGGNSAKKRKTRKS